MNAPEEAPLKVALLGAGVVGSQVARILLNQRDHLASRIGRPLDLVGIGVRNMDVERPGISPELFTTDLLGLVSSPGLDLVIEVIGGIEPAGMLLRTAIANGASVVTANKALLAAELSELSRAADEHGVDLLYEAAVAGAIPIIRPLRESLVGDEVSTVMGIVNGTTNYILDKMTSDGLDFEVALRQAQELGFAEADPSADVDGHDAAAKAAILAGLAFHTDVKGNEVACEGITGVTPEDVAAATQLDCVIKLLAVAKLTDDQPQRVIVKVYPTMVPKKHPLAAVGGAYNAVFVESREAGRLMFLGQGAGGAPTASAVMGDVVVAARNRHRGTASHLQEGYTRREVAPVGEARSAYYLRFEVLDRIGILSRVASVFGDHGVSLQDVNQSHADTTGDGSATAQLTLLTHTAFERNLRGVLEEFETSEYVVSPVHFMRVEGL